MTLRLSNFGLMVVLHNSVVNLPSFWSFNQHWIELFWSKAWKGCYRWDWWCFEACCLLSCVYKQSCHQFPKAVCRVCKWNIAKKYYSVCGEDSMELGYQSECREKAKKIKGTLKVHCFKRFMQNSFCQLKFFMTSKCHNPLAEIQYQVALLLQHVSYKIRTFVLVRYEGEL